MTLVMDWQLWVLYMQVLVLDGDAFLVHEKELIERDGLKGGIVVTV